MMKRPFFIFSIYAKLTTKQKKTRIKIEIFDEIFQNRISDDVYNFFYVFVDRTLRTDNQMDLVYIINSHKMFSQRLVTFTITIIQMLQNAELQNVLFVILEILIG